jgi:hypothetical protein
MLSLFDMLAVSWGRWAGDSQMSADSMTAQMLSLRYLAGRFLMIDEIRAMQIILGKTW